MIIDGRQIARDILARTKTRAERLPHPPRVVAIVGDETPATISYLRIKGARAADAGCVFERRPLGASFADADAVIMQLPLPEGVNQKEACDSIPLLKDADVLSSIAREKFERGDADALLPPVVGAVAEIFKTYAIEPRGKRTVVVGAVCLVGAPVATWVAQQGANVEVITLESGDTSALKEADIIVSGAGSPHFIKPEMLKQGVVLIDAGTSESSGVLVGDAEPSCSAKCSLFTPIPGGVGPLSVAYLFENAVTLAERKN